MIHCINWLHEIDLIIVMDLILADTIIYITF